MPTISLPLAIWGKGYSDFLPRWWDGVRQLVRQPDEIVIVTDESNLKSALVSMPELPISIRITTTQGKEYADFWNMAINLCSGDWIAICNVDDQFLPHALDEIEKADALGYNLICDSIQDKDSHNVTMSSWQPEVLAHTWTMVGAEPMKKTLWEAAGGFRAGYLFADWALAMDMKKAGSVKAYDASTIRIIYDRGYDRKTLSGAMQDGYKKAEGYAKLAELARELGI